LAGLRTITEVTLNHGKLAQIPELDLLQVLALLHFHYLLCQLARRWQLSVPLQGRRLQFEKAVFARFAFGPG
jgi:hypothetical protein